MCVAIGRARRIERRSLELGARRLRSWRHVCGCEQWSNRNSRCGGHRNRSRVGWWKSSPTTRRCACRTRRSICRCSCRPAARLRKELTRFLRSKHTTRRPRGHSVMNGQGQLRATLNIRERPAEANDRAVPGHWEGDLLMGKRMHAMATLVERKSRFVMLVALPNGHSADVVADASRHEDHRAARPTPSIAHLGPRQGDGRARTLHHRHRSSPSTSATRAAPATRIEREHQRAAAPILPEAFRDRALHPGRPRRCRRRTQRQASTNPRLAVTITSTRRSVAMTT